LKYVRYAETMGAFGPKMFENKISKRILEGSLGKRRPAEKPRNWLEGEMLSDAAKLFNRENWRT